MFIVKQWGLKEGQQLEWTLELCDSNKGELVAVVKRVKPTTNNTKEMKSKK